MTAFIRTDEYRRVTVGPEGTQEFELRVVCTDSGPLDDKGIFLLKIFSINDATSDIFQRICNVADVETYSNDRDTALANNDEYWRAYELVKVYDDVEVADQAVTIFSDRINALANDYTTYKDDFVAYPTPEGKSYPTTDPSYVDSVKTAYAASVTAFETAQEAEGTAEDARDAATEALAAANTDRSAWETEKDSVCSGAVPEFTLAFNAFHDLYDTTSGPSPSNAITFLGAVEPIASNVEGLILADANTVRLTFKSGPFLPFSSPYIGLEIIGTISGAVGRCISMRSSTHEMWVRYTTPAVPFQINDQITIGGTAHTEYEVGALVDDTVGPLALDTLAAAYDLFETTKEYADAQDANLPTDVASSEASVNCLFLTGVVTTKEAAVATAETALETTEAAYIVAQAATQTAYAVVTAAYDAVKAVCPNWSPDPPVPAHP